MLARTIALAGAMAAMALSAPALAQIYDDDADGPVEYVRICDAFGTGFYYIPGSDTCLRVGGYVNVETRFLGDDMGFGTVVNPPNDFFFLKAPASLTGVGLGANATFATRGWTHTIGLSFSGASGSVEAEEPSGGFAVGFVPGDVSGGPGTTFGNTFGTSGLLNITTRKYSATYGALTPYAGLSSGEVRYSGGISASLTGFETQSNGHMERITDPDNVYAGSELRHTGWTIGVGPKLQMYMDLADDVGFVGSVDAQAVVRQSSLTSHEHLCGFCAGTPTEYSVEDALTSIGGQASANAMVIFKLPENWRFKVSGGVTVGDFHVVDVRLNPDDDSTHIAPRIGAEWQAAVRFERTFP